MDQLRKKLGKLATNIRQQCGRNGGCLEPAKILQLCDKVGASNFTQVATEYGLSRQAVTRYIQGGAYTKLLTTELIMTMLIEDLEQIPGSVAWSSVAMQWDKAKEKLLYDIDGRKLA